MRGIRASAPSQVPGRDDLVRSVQREFGDGTISCGGLRCRRRFWRPGTSPGPLQYLYKTRMDLRALVHRRHQFRLALCGHKIVETGAACLLFMVRGQLGEATFGHFLIASKTGVLTVLPLLGITLTRHARHFANRWLSALFVAACAFFADAIIHESHYPGAYTEAAFTAGGAFALSVIVSYTPVGKQVDRLAEAFVNHREYTA